MKRTLSFVLMILLVVSGLVAVQAQDDLLPDLVMAARTSFHPEGIEYDPATGLFLTGSFTEGSIFTIDDDGVVTEFIADEDLASSIGIHIDHESGRLLVANSDPGVLAPEVMGMAMLGIYDLETGERLHMVDMGALLPESKHFANDMVVDSEGNAYVTDSFSPVIYKVTPDGEASVFAEDERFTNEVWGLNGIEFHPDGYLLVAVLGAGEIYKIPLDDSGSVTQVMLSEPVGGDGLVFDDDGNLIVVGITFADDGTPKDEVVSLMSEDAWETAEVNGRMALDGTLSPTTAAIRDGVPYVVHAHFDALFAGEPVEAFEIVRVEWE